MSTYRKWVFYYFSGTGNSANVVRWMAEIANGNGIETELINIAHFDRKHIPSPDRDALIIFCSPVHGFNYPPVMQSFVRRFPKGNNPILLLNTRAGMLIGKWITPGLSGVTFYFSAFILSLKGYKIRAMFPVDLPSNWISVHPGLNDKTIKYLHKTNKKRITDFTTKVLDGKRDFRSIREIVQDLLISPVSLLYFFAGRFVFAKTYYASAVCNNCGLCVNQCPVHAIKLVDNRPFWTFKCESCMHCMSFCPRKAVETGHGAIIAYMLLFSLVIWSSIELLFGQMLHLDNAIINFVIQTGLLISLLAIWYRIFHFLLRYKWFSNLMMYTSLTFYKFWGKRYKALKGDENSF